MIRETITEEQKAAVLAFGRWYHEIELAPGFVTPSNMTESRPQWEAIRGMRTHIQYGGKSVLDLGTMDGMWAFEAEHCGAKAVVAGDLYQAYHAPVVYERFLLAKQLLGSRVLLVPNVDVHDLEHTMRTPMRLGGASGGFDIVQCLGLLYHVQNPMLALQQIRGVTATGGRMLMETAVWGADGDAPAARFNSDMGVYNDPTTYWAPNLRCLVNMLSMARFKTDAVGAPVRQFNGIHRRILLCTATVGTPTMNDFGA